MENSEEPRSGVLALIQELIGARTKETKKEILKGLSEFPATDLSPEALEVVAGFLNDPAPSIRARAAMLLGHCQSHVHVDALAKLIEDKDDDVAFAAALALGEIGDPRASKPLETCMARFKRNLEKAEGKRDRQRLIEPIVYQDDPARTALTFIWRDRLGHKKAESRSTHLLADARARLEAIQSALDRLSRP